jgi:hypothetical protein
MMQEMLAAVHFVKYLELRQKEQEPCREYVPERPYSVGLALFRRLRSSEWLRK